MFKFVNLFCTFIIISMFFTNIEALKNSNLRDTKKCTDAAFRKMELAATKLISFGPNGRNFPDSNETLAKYCSEGDQLIAQVETFIKECIKKRIADTVMVIMYSVKSSFARKYCGNRKKSKQAAQELMKMAPCMNAHFVRDDHCIMKFVNETKQLVGIKEDSLKIPHICCNYVKSLQCFNNQIDQHSCLQKYREPIMDIIRGLFVAIIDIICGEYNEHTDMCETSLAKMPKVVTPNRKRYETFMFVLTDVLASIKGFNAIDGRTEESLLQRLMDEGLNEK